MSAYQAGARREHPHWVVTVAGVGVTQGRSLQEAEEMAVDLVEAMTGEHSDDIVVTLTPQLGDDIDQQVAEARRLAAVAQQAQAAATAAARRAVETMRRTMTGRDVARVLGVSEQRVSQIAGRSSAKVGKDASTGSFKAPAAAGRRPARRRSA